MENTNLIEKKILPIMLFSSLVILSLGLLTSISILSLYHVFLIIPILWFVPKNNFKNWSLSMYALCAMSACIVLSILFNQDIMTNGYKALGKVKYFIFGFLAVVPFSFYFKENWNEKKIKTLLYLFFIATSFATIIGIFSRYTHFNFVTWRSVSTERNAGLFGMVMNYAHNIAYFQIIITGLFFYRDELKQYVNKNFLFLVFVINLIGLYLTYTRGAWLAFLVAIPFYLLKNNKKWFLITIVLLTLAGVGVYKIAGESVVRPRSDNERLSQWKAAAMAFKERPILGYGYLNFEHHSTEIKKRYNIDQPQFGGHAHNNFFEMLASTGILGFTAFIFWLAAWFIEMYKRNDIVSKISIPFIITFIVSGLTQSTISLGINLFFVMSVYTITQIRINKSI